MTTICLSLLIGITSNLYAQTLIAGWDFQTTTNGGTATAVSPATPKVYISNFGAGTIYLDGTNNSSNWFVPVSGITGTELNSFGGTANNAGTGFSTVTSGASSLALVGGTSQAANGKFAIFSFNMTGFINLTVSYASQRTSTGFTSQHWEYSTNGTTWTTLTTVTTLASSFGLITLPTTAGLNGAATAFLRTTFNGATTATSNNRLDNIQLNATAGVTFNTDPISGSPFCISEDNSTPVSVSFLYGGTPNPGNIYTAELSSSTGSFASPLVIGNLPSTSSTGTIAANIPAGTISGTGYRIRVKSSDPVATAGNNGTDLVIDKVVATASNNGPVCAGLSLQLFANGGVTYSWTGPNSFTSGTQNPTIPATVNADSGVFIATAISTLGCTDTASTLAVVITCGCIPPTISSNVTQPLCNGASNGSIDIAVSGGVAPYTFQWSSSAVTEDISGVSAGIYSVIVTDFILCVDTFYITMGEPSLINPSVAITNPGCQGLSNGSINLTVGGGTPGYTYLWDNSAVTEDISGLSAGLYSVTITDMNGCITNTFGVLTDPDVFTLSSVFTDVTCAGINNGSINLTASNDTVNNSNPGILISEFLANPTGTDSSKEWVELIASKFINFAMTPYTVIVSNNATATTKGWVQGGVASATTNGTYAFEISSGIVSPGDVFYVGGSNMAVSGTKLRTIDVSTTGGDGGIGTATTGGILGNGGTNADGIAVFNGSAATLDSNSVPVDAIFYGTGTGNAVVAGGTAGFTLPNNDRYSGGYLQTTSFIGPDAAGNDLFVRATGAYNTLSGAYSQRVWASTLISSYSSSLVNMNNSNSYLWSNGATTEDISGLAGGVYTVTATTSNGCTATHSVTISAPVSLSISANLFDVSCFGASDGGIDLTVTGGQTPYSYLWNDADLNEDRSFIPAGVYTVTVTDANGCFVVDTFTVTQPNDITFTITVTNPSCFGASDGALDLTVSGGTQPYQYAWITGDTTQDISGQPASFYFVDITDANGCITGGIEFINDPAQIIINNFTPNNGGAGVQITINGSGFTGATAVEFDGVNASFNVISDIQIDAIVPPGADTGFISVFTNSTCSATSVDTFFYNPAACVPPTLSAVATNASCFGASDGSINLTVSGGMLPYTFVWNNSANSEDIAGLIAGTYSVIVSDAANCPDTLDVIVAEPGIINGTATITNVTCNGNMNGSIDLSVNGGTMPYTFSWSNGDATEDITNLIANTYTVTILDNNSCAGIATFVLVNPPVLTLTLSVIHPGCAGASSGSITSTVSGGIAPFTYAWSNAAVSANLNGVNAGTYTLIVTDAYNCSISTSKTLVDPTPFTLSIISQTEVDCFGASNGAIDIAASNDPLNPGQNPGLLLSEFLADPAGTDAPFEWVELIATKTIDFSVTPYTIVVANNGTANTKGWRAGAALTYAFQISTGLVNKGDVFYVGGSSMAPTGTKLRIINTSNTPGDGFGNLSASGNIGNGGTNADGIAVFNMASSAIDSSTVPVDAIFFGSGIGGAMVNAGANGYTLPNNDRYSGGNLITGSFLAPNIVSGSHHRAAGSFNTATGVYTSPRTWTVQAAFTDGASAVTVTENNTYAWSNGATSQDISGLSANTYTVTATNQNGCTASISTTITQPNDLTISGFTPPSGNSGTSVIISGAGFTGVDVVNFNGLSAMFSIDNDGQITATVPASVSTGLIELINTSCDTTLSANPFVVSVSSANFTITALIEGFFDGVSGMVPVLATNGISIDPTESDTIRVELRDQLTPTTVIASGTAVIKTNGQAMFTFPGSVIGQNGYIAVFHRNAVQTWSNLITFSANTLYDFTINASDAFGSNQSLLSNGKYGFYSGDVNQDESLDIVDQGAVDNAIFNFDSGYIPTDLTGDGSVGIDDQGILDNNLFNFIGPIHP